MTQSMAGYQRTSSAAPKYIVMHRLLDGYHLHQDPGCVITGLAEVQLSFDGNPGNV